MIYGLGFVRRCGCGSLGFDDPGSFRERTVAS